MPESFLSDNGNIKSIKPIQLNASPVNLDTNQYLLKRSLDVLGALVMILSILPLAILTACAIKFTDGGPIFYSQLRLGQSGKDFKMYKFRSMIVNSDYSAQQVVDHDPRVTFILSLIHI